MSEIEKMTTTGSGPSLRSSHRSCVVTAGLIGLCLCLASCVTSETPLLANSKPLLGPQFNMVIYRDFIPGKGFDFQQADYRWISGSYTRNSVTTAHVIRFVTEPLGGNDYLVEQSQSSRADADSHIFTYWIGRKVTDGTYLIFPIDEQDLSSADRDTVCAKDQSEGLCIVHEHEQLVLAAKATASKPVRNPAVGILVDEGAREGASVQLVKERH